MDLGSQNLVLESVDENQVTPERRPLVDHKTTSSGNSISHENDKLGTQEAVDADALPADGFVVGNATPSEREVKSAEPLSSPPSTASSPAGDTPSTKKGYGLKKWRRIRRDITKDVNASPDSNKILKRVLPAQANTNNPSAHKPPNSSARTMQNSETSVGSVSGSQYDGVGDGPAVRASTLSSAFAAAPTFAAGVDSDNSEDRSSKSSTAASVPKFRSELPSGFGYVGEKSRAKHFSGKSLSNSTQRAQQGRGRVESSKKPRGERIKIEKENSHSSVESDSRSSNFIFVQANFSATSNGKKSEISRDYEGECSDEGQEIEQQFSEEVQTGYNKENAGDSEGHSQDGSAADIPWKAKREKRENHHSSKDRDPLVESIVSLNSVQESLEKELQKFTEIAKEPFSPHYSSVNSGSPHDFYLDSEQGNQATPRALEIQVLTLTENVEHLETMLEETRAALQVKESRVSELEATLNNASKLPKEESGSTAELQQETCKALDAELEGLFRQRIEAEVEYLAIMRTIENVKVREQETLKKLSLAETKAERLKKEVEDIGSLSKDIIGVDEVLKLQKGTCKASFYFFMQLILLAIAFCLLILRFSPESASTVPT